MDPYEFEDDQDEDDVDTLEEIRDRERSTGPWDRHDDEE